MDRIVIVTVGEKELAVNIDQLLYIAKDEYECNEGHWEKQGFFRRERYVKTGVKKGITIELRFKDGIYKEFGSFDLAAMESAFDQLVAEL